MARNGGSISQLAVTLHHVAAFCFAPLRLFKTARVLVRLDQVARSIVNADHSIMRAATKLYVADCIRDCVWLAVQ
jgi:hypothetical protein